MIKTNGQGFPDDMVQLGNIIENGGLALHPTDTFWSVSAALPFSAELDRVPANVNTAFPDKVLLVRDIPMLKQYIIDLHPRVETLLAYFERPLIVLGRSTKHFPEHLQNNRGLLACTITNDPFCIEILRQVKTPLITMPLIDENMEGQGFEHLKSHIISEVDYVSYYGRYSDREIQLCPVISYDEKGNIAFEFE